MGFGSLSSAQQILVRLYLLGGPQYAANLKKAGINTQQFTAANAALGKTMATTNKRSFMHNQLLFMARRGLFYATLGTIGLTAEVIKMGFAYDNAIQQARVSLETTIKPASRLNQELSSIFRIAAFTPFQTKDIAIAFRQMYLSFRPFHVTLKTINDSILAITDNLAATGKVTPAALQRVSIALGHMANMGHLTGQTVNQLAKDGLQLGQILHKELGVSAEQTAAGIGALNISSRDVLMAIIRYSKTDAGIAGQALRQSTETLGGAFSTFKDLVSQAAGGAIGGPGGQKGLFGSLQKTFAGVDKQLAMFYRTDKPITLTNIAEALDRQLSPKTHIVINLFLLLESTFKGIIGTLYVFVKAVGFVVEWLNKLTSVFGANRKAAKILGYALGILIGLWLTTRLIMIGIMLVADTFRFSLFAVKLAIDAVTIAQGIQNGVLIEGSVLQAIMTGKWYLAASIMAGRVVTAIRAVTGALALMGTAELITFGWVIALIAGFGILYWKWLAFRRAVNLGATAIFNFLNPVSNMINLLRHLYNLLQDISQLVQHPIGKATSGKGFMGFLSNVVNTTKASLLPFGIGKAIPDAHFASGGTMWRSGMALVGERGPELVHLPGGARVIPNGGTVQAVGYNRGGDGNDRPIVVQVMLDRKVLAQGVARANQDYAARR